MIDQRVELLLQAFKPKPMLVLSLISSSKGGEEFDQCQGFCPYEELFLSFCGPRKLNVAIMLLFNSSLSILIIVQNITSVGA